VITRIGGVHLIRSCGQPVTFVGDQSELAWELAMNVGNVGFHPGRSIDSGKPIVYFKPHQNGWEVRLYNTLPVDAARCGGLAHRHDLRLAGGLRVSGRRRRGFPTARRRRRPWPGVR